MYTLVWVYTSYIVIKVNDLKTIASLSNTHNAYERNAPR